MNWCTTCGSCISQLTCHSLQPCIAPPTPHPTPPPIPPPPPLESCSRTAQGGEVERQIKTRGDAGRKGNGCRLTAEACPQIAVSNSVSHWAHDRNKRMMWGGREGEVCCGGWLTFCGGFILFYFLLSFPERSRDVRNYTLNSLLTVGQLRNWVLGWMDLVWTLQAENGNIGVGGGGGGGGGQGQRWIWHRKEKIIHP